MKVLACERDDQRKLTYSYEALASSRSTETGLLHKDGDGLDLLFA